jgi:predicted small integral membrane protein
MQTSSHVGWLRLDTDMAYLLFIGILTVSSKTKRYVSELSNELAWYAYAYSLLC